MLLKKTRHSARAKKQRISLLALALSSLGLSASCAFAYDQLYVFGDSLSDTGNIGRYTYDSQKYPLYDEVIAQQIGTTLTPSNQGGTNYAQAGGVAVPSLNTSYNTQNQLQNYLAKTHGQADGNGLYIHWIGGNDLAAAVKNPSTAPQTAYISATAAAAQVNQLLSAGAGTVIVPTVPNIGATPLLMMSLIQQAIPEPLQANAIAAASNVLNSTTTPDNAARIQTIHQGLTAAAQQVSAIPIVQQQIASQLIAAYDTASGQAEQLTNFYNSTEDSTLAANGAHVVRVDTNQLFSEVLAQPGQFGFTNTAGTACPPNVASAQCTSQTPGFDSSQSFFFADGFHPSPMAHQFIADYMLSVLNAPAQAIALTQATAAMARDSRATLDSRMQQLHANTNPLGALGIFGGYSHQKYDYKKNWSASDGDAKTNQFTLGLDYQFTDTWLLGGLVSYGDDKQHPSNRYKYKAKGWLCSLYNQWKLYDNFWLNGDMHYATLNYDDIQRTVTLGPIDRKEQGSTHGNQWGARLTGGYDWQLTSWLNTGPMAQFAWDYSRVGGYQEDSNSSTAMRFNDQVYHSQIGSLGWRLEGQFAWANPYAELSYRHQFGDNVYRSSGGLKSTQTNFEQISASQDKDWIDMTLGLSMPLADNLGAFAAVSQTGGLSSGEQFNYNVGLSARF